MTPTRRGWSSELLEDLGGDDDPVGGGEGRRDGTREGADAAADADPLLEFASGADGVGVVPHSAPPKPPIHPSRWTAPRPLHAPPPPPPTETTFMPSPMPRRGLITHSGHEAKLYSLARKWLLIDTQGRSSVLEASKMQMQRELGVPFRDLMILDPNLPTAYPSAIFIRPRAIVVNLEHIKMIVVSTYALLLNTESPEPHTRRFVKLLKQQLTPRHPPTDASSPRRQEWQEHNANQSEPAVNFGGGEEKADSTKGIGSKGVKIARRSTAPGIVGRERPVPSQSVSRVNSFALNLEADAIAAEAAANIIDGLHDAFATTDLLGLKQSPSDLRVLALPFELRVVEAALHDVCKRLLDETMSLELDATPALKELTNCINSSSLERVRRVKGRMNSLTSRVGAVREEMSKLLADDSDMMAMCLTTKEEEAEAAAAMNMPNSGQSAHRLGHSMSRGHEVQYDDEDNDQHTSSDAADIHHIGGGSGRGGVQAAVPPVAAAAHVTGSVSSPSLDGSDGEQSRGQAHPDLLSSATLSPSTITHSLSPPVKPVEVSALKEQHEKRRRHGRSRREKLRAAGVSLATDGPPSISSSSSGTSSSNPSSKSSTSSNTSKETQEAHEGVEALLEAYFMHIDLSHKRLSELREAIEDTEDLAEIYLDSQRNQLIKIDLLISNGMLSIGLFSMVAGVFGMNLRTGWESQPKAFREVCFISGALCVALFVTVTLYLRSQKLLQM